MRQASRHYGKFLLLWAGELISQIGGGLTRFGLGAYAFRQSGMSRIKLMRGPEP